MKLIKILLAIFMLYISAYSKDILQYSQKTVSDRNLDINLENVNIITNDFLNNANEEIKIDITNKLNEAKLLIKESKYNEAINICNLLEESYKDYYDIYYTRGLAYYRHGDLYYASLDFSKIINWYINDREVHTNITDFFYKINEYEYALIAYISAYKIYNDNYWLYLAGDIALRNFDIKSAEKYYSLCIKNGSECGYEGFGDISIFKKQYDDAINNYNVALIENVSNNNNLIRINSKISNATVQKELYIWDSYIISNDYTNAFIKLDSLSNYTKDFPEIELALAKTYFKTQNYTEAKSMINSFIRNNKDFDEAYAILAQIFLYEGKEREAINILEEGLKYSYNKPRLYETLANMLYNYGYLYYPNEIISQIVGIYDISDENKIEYTKYLIFKRDYKKARDILVSINAYRNTVARLMKSLENNLILDRADYLYNKGLYVNVVNLIMNSRFEGYEEQKRLWYIANSYSKLGSTDEAIKLLKTAFDNNTISIDNVLLLRELLGIRVKSNDISDYQKEIYLTDIKSTLFWEDDLKYNTSLITDKVFEYLRNDRYEEAINYIDGLKNIDTKDPYIKKINSIIYGYYASYLYNQKDYEKSKNIANLATRINRDNYDAIAIKNKIYIDSYLASMGNYNNVNGYVKFSEVRREVLRIAPAYMNNVIALAESLAYEYDNSAYDMTYNIFKYVNVEGAKDAILGRIYSKSRLYGYSINAFDRASKYMEVDLLWKVDSIVNVSSYPLSLFNLNNEYESDRDYYALSKLNVKLGNNDAAMRYANRAVLINGDNLDYLYQISYVNEITGNINEALEGYENIISINKNQAAANYRASIVALNNFRDYNKAQKYALNYISLLPDDASGYALLARIYKLRAESYIDRNTNTLLKQSLQLYKTALNKSVWGKDMNDKKYIEREIEDILNKLLK
ncbi:tetratricopeptide repeat protein [Brachyspira sp. SAP_772]|uniref:tetratricopeptide repeat protein n=1 Tax=Brachyspira sp. SAP_772 TaxID=2608385 RepID=UPI0012F4C166|nr:tetratricopeptide repeat protein [Brachyspira sp. SAP_772]